MDPPSQIRSTCSKPPIPILGVPFDNVTTSEAVALIEEMIASRRPHYLATANVDFLVQAGEDVELRRILFEADLVLCDGTPLVWASRLLGNPLPERVAGSDLVPLLIRVAAQKGYRIFFLGGSPETAQQAIASLQAKYPTLTIAGHFSPPFAHLLGMDHDEIKRRILSAKPDLLFVSFGCPKQEKWIAMHYRSLGVPVSIGVGGTIDFLAGRLARAPLWMQKTGTEWIFRLAQEPRRLLGRYLKDIWYFGRLLLAQWWRLQFRARSRPGQEATPASVNSSASTWLEFIMPDWLDCMAVQNGLTTWNDLLADHRHCILELRNVRFIDSTGVGLLIRLQKRAQSSGKKLILVAPSRAVNHALKAMRLETFFEYAPDVASAQKALEGLSRQSLPALASQLTPAASGQPMVWQGEVTAANADDVWSLTERYIACSAPGRSQLRLDLNAVRFIDSSGVGILIRAKKLTAQNGVKLVITGLQPDVRNVLRLSRLESYLLEN